MPLAALQQATPEGRGDAFGKAREETLGDGQGDWGRGGYGCGLEQVIGKFDRCGTDTRWLATE